MNVGKNQVITELQMLTGLLTDDLDYLIFKLLEGGSYFEGMDKQEKIGDESVSQVVDLNSWFKEL